MSKMLDVAREYVKRGISVIPLLKRDKIPDSSVLPQKEVDGKLVWCGPEETEVFEDNGFPKKTWVPFQTRLPTDNELVQWFADGERNIGIVTGKISGLVVVDLDGPAGIRSGLDLGISSPIQSITGRPEGGKHLFFKYPGELVKNRTDLAPGVDFRGDGGYVVAPPSIHPDTGRSYTWIGNTAGSPLPEFNCKWLKMNRPGNAPGWIAEQLMAMRPGNRDVPITRIVGRLHRDGWGPGDIKALLVAHPEVEAHGLGDLDRIIKSICSRPRSGADSSSEEIPSGSFSSFVEEETVPKWIVSDLIPASAIGFFAGLPETCKTWAMMDLAIEASRGGMWLGKFQTKKSRVLFIDQERAASETRRRLRALIKGKEIPPASLDGGLTVWCGTSIRLDLDASFQALHRKLLDLRPELIIVDSFATFHTTEENNRADIQAVLEKIKAIRAEFGATILFIDHETKAAFKAAEEGEAPSAFRMAGSIAKPAAAEVVFTVRSKGPGVSAFYHTKSTQGPTSEKFMVEVVDLLEDRSSISVRTVE